MTSGLTRAGFTADAASNLDGANEALRAATYDLILLDLGLPDGDGVDWLKRKRASGLGIPVLVVTARDALGDRIKGLDSGGDDYLVKPFEIEELLARCRALLRRPQAAQSTILSVDGIDLDLTTRSVRVNDRAIELGRRETAMLEVLLRRSGTVVPRDVIENQLYSYSDEVTPNAIEAALSRLRRKLAEAGSPAQIHTVRGVGYMLRTS
jgi:two-component system response regulator QseB